MIARLAFVLLCLSIGASVARADDAVASGRQDSAFTAPRMALLAAGLVGTVTLASPAGGSGALVATTSPQGIINLELAFSKERADEVLGTWSRQPGLPAVRRAIGWDFGFLVSYSTLLSTVAFIEADRAQPEWAPWARRAGWASLVAGGLDAAENLAMLKAMSSPTRSGITLASAFATAKFALLLAILGCEVATAFHFN